MYDDGHEKIRIKIDTSVIPSCITSVVAVHLRAVVDVFLPSCSVDRLLQVRKT